MKRFSDLIISVKDIEYRSKLRPSKHSFNRDFDRISAYLKELLLLSQGLINAIQCQQNESINKTQSANIVNYNNKLHFHDIIDNKISVNFTKTIDCNFKTKQSLIDERILIFKSCQPMKILVDDKRIPEIIKNSSNIFIISFEIDTKLKEISRKTFENFKILQRPVIVNVYSKYDEKEVTFIIEKGHFRDVEFLTDLFALDDYEEQLNFALRQNCGICLRLLNLIDTKKYEKELKIKNDDTNFKCDIDCFRAIFSLPFDFNFNEIPENVLEFLHKNYSNDLKEFTTKTAWINENFTKEEVLKQSSNFVMNLEGITGLAWLQGQFRVFEFLIRADCFYPKHLSDFASQLQLLTQKPKPNRYLKKLQLHISSINDFHTAIALGHLKEVQKFLKNHPNLKFFRDENNKSAMQVAFENEQFEIYAILKSHGLLFSNPEELALHYEEINELNSSKREKIRQFNYKHLQSLGSNESYIEKLIQKTKINSSRSTSKEKLTEIVRKAYTEIDEIASDILKISAKSDELEIIFDFEYAVGDEYEPGITAVGLTVRQYNYVLIAAANLLHDDEEERNYVLGTIAHELMHFAMYLIYDNDANPYKKDDIDGRNLFRNLTEDAKEKEEIESFWAYDENADDFHIELIARIPDILLNHKHNVTRINLMKKEYSELFDFYENQVLNDIKKLTSSMDIREKLRNFNHWFDVIRQIGETETEIDLKDCEIVEEKKDEEQSEENNEISEEEFESDETDMNYEKYERLEVYDESNDDEGYESENDYEESKENKLIKKLSQNLNSQRQNWNLVGKISKNHSKKFKTSNNLKKFNKNSALKMENSLQIKNLKDKKRQKQNKFQTLINHNVNQIDQQTFNYQKLHLKTTKINITVNNFKPKISQLQNIQEQPKDIQNSLNSLFNFTFQPLETTKYKAILTNFPSAVERSILKKVKKDDILGIFLSLTSLNLENFLTTIHAIDNFDHEIYVFVHCDDIDYLPLFLETIEVTTIKHFTFISSNLHQETFEALNDYFEIQEFNVNWQNLCPKSQEFYLSQTFYFQNDQLTLNDVIGDFKAEELNFLPLKDIEDEEINSIAIDSLETNENYLIERKFIDENGKVQRLKDFVIDLWKIDDAQIKNDDESEESDEVLKKSSKISNSSKNLLKIHTRSIRSAQNFQNSSTFIISDLPQNGKSTALKQIALEIRKHSPSTWVVYVNFKEFNLEEFDWKNSTVLDFLTQKSSKFDIEIFKLFAKHKKVVFIFDELQGNKNELKFIAEAKKFSQQIWIAANQNHVKILKEKFRGKVLKFAEIDQNDVQQFLEYFDESHEENLMKLIEEISVSHLGTIKEIAEAVEELDDTLNIYKIFTSIILKKRFENSIKINNDLSASLAKPLEILKTHQLIALTQLYGKKSIANVDQILNCLEFKLISFNEDNKIKFIENSFAEFFAAQFFIDNFFKNDISDENWRIFVQAKKFKSWSMVKRFIKEFIVLNEAKLNENKLEKFKEVIKMQS